MSSTIIIVDTAIRAAAAMAIALIGVSILRDARNRIAARLTALLCLTIMAHLATVALVTPTGQNDWDTPLEILSTAVPAMFWLVSKAVFVDGYRLPRQDVLVAGTYILYGGSFDYIQAIDQFRIPAGIMLRMGMFGFTVAALTVAWRGRADDLVEDRRQLRDLLIWSVGIFALLIPVMEILIYADVLPRTAVTVSAGGILAISIVNAWFLLGLREDDLLRRTAAAVLHPAAPDEPRLLAALDRLMVGELLYRSDGVGIADVAARVGVPEYRLRRLINQRLGHRNFAAYLNGFRLAEVKAALADPDQREVPILTMALDAGFGSLAPFNRAFRDAEGMTPTEYRQRALNGRTASLA